jgi:hypothetical protein
VGLREGVDLQEVVRGLECSDGAAVFRIQSRCILPLRATLMWIDEIAKSSLREKDRRELDRRQRAFTSQLPVPSLARGWTLNQFSLVRHEWSTARLP